MAWRRRQSLGQKPTHRPVSPGVGELEWALFACSALGGAESLAFCEETAGQTVTLVQGKPDFMSAWVWCNSADTTNATGCFSPLWRVGARFACPLLSFLSLSQSRQCKGLIWNFDCFHWSWNSYLDWPAGCWWALMSDTGLLRRKSKTFPLIEFLVLLLSSFFYFL